MTVFNFGSINIDHVYQVERFVRPGETLASQAYRRVLGGKGANQSIALARAGASVRHVGAIGQDDHWITQELAALGVDISAIRTVTGVSGHA
ncbi:MAG: ribokinase, partial [Candidatus Competibacteraceae bacterium]|nr:ribokinase [Candidatus Competibacteraceae bacterium]